MPKISVIMGVYNGAKTIERAINSMLTQTMNDFELLICDDCSTDDSVRIIKKYVDKDERIVLLKNKVNSGLAATLNKCIEA